MQNHVTDTHALIWYLTESPRLSNVANQCFEACDRGEIKIYLPSICLVELVYLQERNRIPLLFEQKLDEVLKSNQTNLIIAKLDNITVEYMKKIPRDIVPDMPDRIIAATALQLQLPLISCDSKISKALNTVW